MITNNVNTPILTGGAALCPGSPVIQLYQGLIIYQETQRMICFTFLALCVLNLSHSLDLNVAHQIKKVSDEKIEGMITFSHVYEFFILFQDSQSVGQISVLSGLNRRSRRIFSQLLFAIQPLPFCEPWGLTAQALVSSGWSEGEWSLWLRSSASNFIIFSKTLGLLGLLLHSLIREYYYITILLLWFVISRIGYSWHLVRIAWLLI